MKEYIERGAALIALCADCSLYEEGEPCSCHEHDALLAIPTADVAEVRHGYWVHKMTDYYPYSECSLCGYTLAGDLGN